MIEVNELAKAVEDSLNRNALGFVFRIFSDTNDYKKPTRQGNTVTTYTNGLMQVVQSGIAPAQGLVVATQVARLEVMLKLKPEAQERIEEQVARLRNVLDGVFQFPQIQRLTDESGKVFTVTVLGSPATTGDREYRALIGDSVTFNVFINYTFIENGLNSMDCPIYLDGALIPYTTATQSRIPNIDGAPLSDSDGIALNRMIFSQMGIDLTLPATTRETSAVSAAIIDYLLTGKNKVHKLTMTIGGESVEYDVLFGSTNVALEGVLNAAYKVSFVQAVDYGGI